MLIQVNDAKRPWRFTGFYGSPYSITRLDSWNFLYELGVSNNSPWYVCGDFNEIMYNYVKKWGLSRDERRMELFRNVLAENGLMDLGFSGPWFTWERDNMPTTNIRERLDRGVANEEWFLNFPTASVKHLSHAMFDNCPLLLNLAADVKRRGSFDFCFEA